MGTYHSIPAFTDSTARVSSTAIIHQGVRLGAGVVIHDYVVIYPNTELRANVEVYDHCVLGKLPTSPGNVSRRLKGSYPPLTIGEDTILCPHVVVHAGTTIGAQCLLGDHCSIREECHVGDMCLLSRNVSINYHTSIGTRCKVMDGTHLTGNMTIEDDVFLSVLVSTTNDNSMGRMGYDEQRVRGPIIRRGASVGAAAVLLPGVEIGENAVVGAGSVVTRSVPAGMVVVGSPARVCREVPASQCK